MTRFLFLIPALIIALFTSHTVMANEVIKPSKDGKALHNQACQQCHDNSVYTRPNSIIFSRTALDKRVRFCESMAAAHWTEPQMKSVINYLDQHFYHFKD